MKQMILSRIGFESLRVAFPAACGVTRSRQRARRPAHRCTRTAHPLFSEYPAPWGGDPLLSHKITCTKPLRGTSSTWVKFDLPDVRGRACLLANGPAPEGREVVA